jgi:hypothetical protein
MCQSLEEILGYGKFNPVDGYLTRICRRAPGVGKCFICWARGEGDMSELALDPTIDAVIASCWEENK